MVVKHRYDLPLHTFTAADAESYVVKWLRDGAEPKPVSSLGIQEQKHFRGWLKALFDNQAIDDDLLTSCSPKDFYPLVTTIFDQSIRACRHGLLATETVKQGFDCKHYFLRHWNCKADPNSLS